MYSSEGHLVVSRCFHIYIGGLIYNAQNILCTAKNWLKWISQQQFITYNRTSHFDGLVFKCAAWIFKNAISVVPFKNDWQTTESKFA